MTIDTNTFPELDKVKAKRIRMRDVLIDDAIQPRLRISHDAIRRYKDRRTATKGQGDEPFPPIIAAKLPDGRLVVVDGYHRYSAFEELNEDYIKAKVIQCSFDNACWLAAKANLSHGVPLIRKDHPEVFKRYIRAGQHRKVDGSLQSYRELQAGLGNIRNHTTLRKWMQKEFPAVFAEMAKTDPEPAVEESAAERQHSYEVQEMMENARGVSRCAKLSFRRHAEQDRADIIGQMQWLMEEVAQTIGMTPQEVLDYEAPWEEGIEEDLSL
jgi:hypothetical protein